ncbi:uncharacterized protein LOC124418966 [Lucilia cuprina]|uniref:uncharacterized protein LOC124418966 n=1 Tax=Lucilia cuprina TaxID=7375 RepID=UPI001F05A380|nr:uncharacterized protein LOC124418966 [Lucilia cuprina]
MRIFGCRAYELLPKEKRSKFDPKCTEMVFIGYAVNGYRLWNPVNKQIVVARNVKFDESNFPAKVMSQTKAKNDGDEESKNKEDILVVKRFKVPVAEGEEEADSILEMELFEGFDDDNVDPDDGDTTITENGHAVDRSDAVNEDSHAVGEGDAGDACNDAEINVNDDDEEEAVALRQQTNLAGQRQSCRERRAPGKLTYNTYFDQINLSKVILSAEPACFNEI